MFATRGSPSSGGSARRVLLKIWLSPNGAQKRHIINPVLIRNTLAILGSISFGKCQVHTIFELARRYDRCEHLPEDFAPPGGNLNPGSLMICGDYKGAPGIIIQASKGLG